MSVLGILLVGIFLPLFPLSIVFNYLLGRVPGPLPKGALLLLWPLAGLLMAAQLGVNAPGWVMVWAALTALLYGFRLIAQRDAYGWAGFLATSAWSLLWILLQQPDQERAVSLIGYALGFGVPLVLVVLLSAELEKRFGAAYTHLYGGLASTMPRFAVLLAFSTLAAIATPVFPAFFVMLKVLTLGSPVVAVIALLAWLLWSWAGIRLLQGLLIGSEPKLGSVSDLGRAVSFSGILILLALAVAGLSVTGDMS